ncbi:hypothetical protein RBSH_05362 [Rhodopirellula baltica SH28]|uniref:Uncharacterized protein n=1 Tax=Rhodopirellula baltica SH28 TaxID=993517 RepID=K5DA47_RHOBT|nr:hypothetical protein RBSH_05362 [Rhodopirellula baltica SH28]
MRGASRSIAFNGTDAILQFGEPSPNCKRGKTIGHAITRESFAVSVESERVFRQPHSLR